MYSAVRSKNIEKLKFLYILSFFAETISLYINYQDFHLLYLIQTVAGINNFLILNMDSLFFLNCIVKELGYSYLLLYWAVGLFYWTKKFFPAESILLFFVGSFFRINFCFVIGTDNDLKFKIVMFALNLKMSLLFILTLCEAEILVMLVLDCVNYYFLSASTIIAVIIYKDFTMGVTSIIILYNLWIIEEANTQIIYSLYANIIITLINLVIDYPAYFINKSVLKL